MNAARKFGGGQASIQPLATPFAVLFSHFYATFFARRVSGLLYSPGLIHGNSELFPIYYLNVSRQNNGAFCWNKISHTYQ